MALVKISFDMSIDTKNWGTFGIGKSQDLHKETKFLNEIELAISKWWDELHQGKQEVPDLYHYKIIDNE